MRVGPMLRNFQVRSVDGAANVSEGLTHPAVCLSKDGIALRRIDPDDAKAYSVDGVTPAYAIVRLEEVRVPVMGAPYGADATIGAGDGSWKFRISFDGGTTFRYVSTGTTWASATADAHFSTIEAIAGAIETMTVDPLRRVVWEARVDAADDLKSSPVLSRVCLMAPIENVRISTGIQDSLNKWLEDNLKAPLWTEQRAIDGSQSVAIETRMRVKGASKVFNLKTDPNKGTNLLDGFTPSTKDADGNWEGIGGEVALTGAAPSTYDPLRIEFLGAPPVFMGGDDDFYKQDAPHIYVYEPSADADSRFGLSEDVEFDYVNQQAIVVTTEFVAYNASIMVKAKRQADVMVIMEEMRRLWRSTECYYLPTGERLKIAMLRPYSDLSSLKSNFFVGRADVMVLAKDQLSTKTYPLVQEIGVQTTGMGELSRWSRQVIS